MLTPEGHEAAAEIPLLLSRFGEVIIGVAGRGRITRRFRGINCVPLHRADWTPLAVIVPLTRPGAIEAEKPKQKNCAQETTLWAIDQSRRLDLGASDRRRADNSRPNNRIEEHRQTCE